MFDLFIYIFVLEIQLIYLHDVYTKKCTIYNQQSISRDYPVKTLLINTFCKLLLKNSLVNKQ